MNKLYNDGKPRKRGAGLHKKWHTEEERKIARRNATRKHRLKKGKAYERNKFLKRHYQISLEDYIRMYN